jgi:VWFA-related protein
MRRITQRRLDRRAFARLIFAALLAVALLPLDGTPARADGELDVSIQSVDDSTDQTSVVLTVLGPDKRPLIGLRPEQVQVDDNGTVGKVVALDRAVDTNVGIGVVLTIQTSSSMAASLPNVREAARALIASLSPNDQAAIVSFANQVTVVQPMTADRQALGAALDRLTAAGNPAVYDAVITSVNEASRASTPRKLVILLTDAGGVGRISQATREEAIERAAASGVSVNSLGFGTVVDLQFLSELGQRTQGRVLSAPTIADVSRAYGELAELLRSQYVLRFESTVPLEQRDRQLTVRVAASPGTGTATRNYQTARQAPVVPTQPPEPAPVIPPPVAPTSESNNTPLLLGGFALLLLAAGGVVYRRRTRSTRSITTTAPDRRPIPAPEAAPARPRRVAEITIVDGPEHGRSTEIRDGVVTVGSGPGVSLRLADHTLAPERLRLFWRDDQLMLHDLGASGRPTLGEWQTVRHDDVVNVGRYHLRITIHEAGAGPEAAEADDGAEAPQRERTPLG